MISLGRYLYNLQDIAESKAGSIPNPMLAMMKAEVAEFEEANPDEAKKIRAQVGELAKT